MARALEELRVTGVDTTVAFHRRVMQEPSFRSGDFTIRYLDEHPELLGAAPADDLLVRAAVAAALLEDESRVRRSVRRTAMADRPAAPSRWRDRGWR
jgi:acetyl-CoA carboxylase, biotin carboxylase subunit